MRLITSVITVHIGLIFALFLFQTPLKKNYPKKVSIHTIVLKSPQLSLHQEPAPSIHPIEEPVHEVVAPIIAQEPPSPPVKKDKPVVPKVKTIEEAKPKSLEKIPVKEIVAKDIKTPAKVNKIKPTQAPSVKNQDKLLSLMQESLKTLDKSTSSKKTTNLSSYIPKNGSKELSCLSIGETNYQEMLVQYLQSQLSLPENGEVKMKLSLLRGGSVDQISILEASSQTNRTYVQKVVPTLLLPEFGVHFKGESKHSFLITLTSTPTNKNSR